MDPAATAAEMTGADWGILGIFIAGIVAQWRMNASIVNRMMEKNEALLATVMGAQSKTTDDLAESVHKVETAVIRSDSANVAAIGSLKESVNARLDNHSTLHEKHDARFATHDGDIKTLHGGHTLLDYRVTAIEKRLPNS